MSDYIININVSSDDDVVLYHVALGLKSMRTSLVDAADMVGRSFYQGRSDVGNRADASKKIKTVSARLLEIANVIDDIDLQLEQLLEDRPDVGKN